jgi:hypothetical protein
MNRAVLLSWITLLALPEASATAFSCGTAVPSLRSVALGTSLRDIQRRLGSGKLMARALNPGLNDQTYYRWRIRGADWLISFDQAMKAVWISYASRLHLKPYDDVTLNKDSMKSIAERFGPPSVKRGPTVGEGEYAFYSIVYYCGPGASYEIEFRTDRTCEIDMAICLEEAAFLSLRVKQITIAKRAPEREP